MAVRVGDESLGTLGPAAVLLDADEVVLGPLAVPVDKVVGSFELSGPVPRSEEDANGSPMAPDKMVGKY